VANRIHGVMYVWCEEIGVAVGNPLIDITQKAYFLSIPDRDFER
jgi:hypothetical protein